MLTNTTSVKFQNIFFFIFPKENSMPSKQSPFSHPQSPEITSPFFVSMDFSILDISNIWNDTLSQSLLQSVNSSSFNHFWDRSEGPPLPGILGQELSTFKHY
jgi:hypothetical protein